MAETKTLGLVGAEMSRQIEKWGEQNHPSYTKYAIFSPGVFLGYSAHSAKYVCDMKAARGDVSWTDIFMEEVLEAFEEAQRLEDTQMPEGQRREILSKLKTELIQVAAVATSWVESIDRNGK